MTKAHLTKPQARRLITLLALTFSCAALAEGGGAIGGGGWGIKPGQVGGTPGLSAGR